MSSDAAQTRRAPLTPAERREVVRRVLLWYRDNARDLPWRRPEATPWQVMVSEFMLQQTPVERVRQPWQAWVERWPNPRRLLPIPLGMPYGPGDGSAIRVEHSGCMQPRE